MTEPLSTHLAPYRHWFVRHYGELYGLGHGSKGAALLALVRAQSEIWDHALRYGGWSVTLEDEYGTVLTKAYSRSELEDMAERAQKNIDWNRKQIHKRSRK